MIIVHFKCVCITKEASCAVRFRRTGEDLMDWMKAVQMSIGEAHNILSPKCRSLTMEYAKFSAPENAPGLGMKPELHS